MQSRVWSRRCWPSLKPLGLARVPPRELSVKTYHAPQLRLYSKSAPQFQAVQRLSSFWIPTGGIESSRDSQDDAHSLLVKAGYLRQAHSGIFHMLPLGHRVQQKLERMIDKHMSNLGASKVSLSSITTEDLWKKSGRYVGHGGELFAFKDRKDASFLLSPTHEEEITSLVASAVQSYKDLPLRIYQITRKYRDEARPRQGLLRGREFTMKDLYTFDQTEAQARETYEHVQTAYRAFLDEIKLPYLVAKADSGAMGGNLSHEYHFVSAKGEDDVISCDTCGYTINDELAMVPVQASEKHAMTDSNQINCWYGITKDRRTLITAWFPLSATHGAVNEINLNVIKALVPDADLSVENPVDIWNKESMEQQKPAAGTRILNIMDERLPPMGNMADSIRGSGIEFEELLPKIGNESFQLTRTLTSDRCQSCGDGTVKIEKAIEIGHTFHLGTRYSKPLEATIVNKDDQRVAIEMGCHGIGVSRLIAAIASILSDAKGLNWPASIAPFQAIIIPGKGNEEDAGRLYQGLHTSVSADQKIEDFDAIVDDRSKPMGWKLNDADLVGYSIIVVLGRAWKNDRKVEVQCRRLGVKEEVHESQLADTVAKYLGQL